MNIKIHTQNYQGIIDLYLRGLSSPKIANIFRVKKDTITRILKKYGIHIKGSRKYCFNELFFKEIDTEEKAYWLGFILADGGIVRNKYSSELIIALQEKDKKHLQKFLNSISANHKILKNKNHFYIKLISKKLGNILSQYGIVPRKTFKTYFPKQIPENLQRHFIRGVFDGDGCFGIYNRKDRNRLKTYDFSIAGTYNLLKNIQNILVNKCKVNNVKISRIGLYSYNLHYCGNIQVPRILNYLYRNSTIYLDRKYKKYLVIS